MSNCGENFGEREFSSVSTATIASKDAFCSIFRDLQSPLSGEKKCKHFSSPEKKIHLAESCGWGALAANVGPPGRPGGYQSLTLGQPSVNVRSTLGQRWVSSLAIPGYVKPGVNIKPGISFSEQQPLGSVGRLEGSIYKRETTHSGFDVASLGST